MARGRAWRGRARPALAARRQGILPHRVREMPLGMSRVYRA